MNTTYPNTETDNQLIINDKAKSLIVSIGKWTKFVSIYGIVMMCLAILLKLASMFMLSKLSALSSTPLVAGEVIQAIISIALYCFFIYVYVRLYKGVSSLSNAMKSNNSEEVETGFRHLSFFATVLGIMAIVGTVLVILSVVLSLFVKSNTVM